MKDGKKYDHGKPRVFSSLLRYFPRALTAVVRVSEFGCEKYGELSWLTVPNGIVRYTNALARHLLAEAETPIDDESGHLHAAHTAWNALARLELILREQEDRDRTSR